MRNLLLTVLFCLSFQSTTYGGRANHQQAQSAGSERPVAHGVELESEEIKGLTNPDEVLSAFQAWLKQKFPTSNKKIIVKFGASWCAPCRKVAPEIERFAAKRSGEYEVISIDLDQYQNLAEALKYGGTIPALFELTKGTGSVLSDPKQTIGPIKGIPNIPNYLKTR